MKKIAAIFITILSILVAEAQQSNQFYIDSLKHELATAEDDTNKVKLLYSLSNLYALSFEDTAATYAQESLNLAQKINFDRGIFTAEFRLTGSLMISGNYPLALEHGFKFLSLAKKKSDTLNTSIANAVLGECYYYMGEYNTSLKYYRENLRLAEMLHIDQIYFPWSNMAHVYHSLNQPDSAMVYAKKAYKRLRDWNDTLFVSNILGDAYAGKAIYDSALFQYRISIAVSLKYHTILERVDGYNGIAGVYKTTNDFDSAAWYSKKVLAEKTEKNYPIGMLRAASMLADIYQLQNKPDSALRYLRIALSIKDSLFSREKTNAIQNIAFKELEKQKEIEASELKYQNRLRIYSLLGGLIALLIIAGVLGRNNRNKQKANSLLQQQKEKVESTLTELKSTQAQLIQSEKMASLGELTAGIAHEIQNPLNFVNNFSEVNKELIEELKSEKSKLKSERDEQLEIEILNNIAENEEKIIRHGKRADSIVKGMMQHSQVSTGQKEPTNINTIADEYLRLSYLGIRAKDKSFNATLETDFDKGIGLINIIPQDIGRVLLNLYNNAFYAVNDASASSVPDYQPTVSVSTKKLNNKVEIRVKDNGNGIPQKVIDKIFQSFFTTKPTGEGTGLGLSLSYDIIKAHGGEIKVETREGEEAEFIIQLPTNLVPET
ncbi:MAG: ATP-binding protein [Ferruginibacter sp.]